MAWYSDVNGLVQEAIDSALGNSSMNNSTRYLTSSLDGLMTYYQSIKPVKSA